MKKLKLTKKLTLNKQIISPLNGEQAAQILGGADAPTWGQYCTKDDLCATKVYNNATRCNYQDTGVTDNGCPTYEGYACDDGQSDFTCFTQQPGCTLGDCTDVCPHTYGDISCADGPGCV